MIPGNFARENRSVLKLELEGPAVPKVKWGTHVLKARSRILFMSSRPYVGPYAKTWARGG